MTAQFLQRVQSYHAYVCSVTGQQIRLDMDVSDLWERFIKRGGSMALLSQRLKESPENVKINDVLK